MKRQPVSPGLLTGRQAGPQDIGSPLAEAMEARLAWSMRFVNLDASPNAALQEGLGGQECPQREALAAAEVSSKGCPAGGAQQQPGTGWSI
jgi:hypothetical protein